MDVHLLALLVAFGAGMAMAVQGTINSVLGRIAGLWEATLVVHTVGLAFISVVIAVLHFGGLGNGSLAKVFSAPWYSWLGGILGGLIVYAVARSIPQVGVANATTAIIIGQTLTAAALDHIGFGGMDRIPFTYARVIGLALLAAGGWMMLKR